MGSVDEVTDRAKGLLEECRNLALFAQKRAEQQGEGFTAPAWASRKIERIITRYLEGETPMSEATAMYVVKGIREYEDKRIAFLAPVHPDGMLYDRRCLGGKVEDNEKIPESIRRAWYDDMMPDYEVTSTTKDSGVKPPGSYLSSASTTGITVKIGPDQAWSIGDVVEMRAEIVGREEDLTEPLRNAPRGEEPAA